MILRKKGYTLTRLTTTQEYICRTGWAGSTTVLPFLFEQDTARISAMPSVNCSWFDEKKVCGPVATDDDTLSLFDDLFAPS